MNSYSSSSSSSSTGLLPYDCVTDLTRYSLLWEGWQNFIRFVVWMSVCCVGQGWTISRRCFQDLILLFASWVSAFLYIGAQMLMTGMILNCWADLNTVWVIMIMKFIEVFGFNLNHLTGLAFQISVYRIMRAQKHNTRVPPLSMNIVGYLSLLALVFTISSAVFWKVLYMTNGYFWVDNPDPTLSKVLNGLYAGYQPITSFCQAVLAVVMCSEWNLLVACFRGSQTVRFQAVMSALNFIISATNGIVTIGYLSGRFFTSISASMIAFSTVAIGMFLQAITISLTLKSYYSKQLGTSHTAGVMSFGPHGAASPKRPAGKKHTPISTADPHTTTSKFSAFEKESPTSALLKSTKSISLKSTNNKIHPTTMEKQEEEVSGFEMDNVPTTKIAENEL